MEIKLKFIKDMSNIIIIVGIILIAIALFGLFYLPVSEDKGIEIFTIQTIKITNPTLNTAELFLSKEEVNNTIYFLNLFMNDGNLSSTFEFKDMEGNVILIKKSSK